MEKTLREKINDAGKIRAREKLYELGKIDAVFELGQREVLLKDSAYNKGFSDGLKELYEVKIAEQKKNLTKYAPIKRNLKTKEGREFWDSAIISQRAFLVMPKYKRAW